MESGKFLAICLIGCCVLTTPAGWSQDGSGALRNDAEASAYLSAFKQRALDAAFESGARVKGVAYIDDQGRLHERAMFSSEADVRGVQVESYLDAMGGEQSLEAVQVSDAARCQLWTEQGSKSGVVAIRLASPPMRQASESTLQTAGGATGGGFAAKPCAPRAFAYWHRWVQSQIAIRTRPMQGRWSVTGQMALPRISPCPCRCGCW